MGVGLLAVESGVSVDVESPQQYKVVASEAPAHGVAAGVRSVMNALGFSALLGDNKTVLVKPNLGWDLYLPGAVTSAEVLKAVVGVLLEDDRKVIIIEADQVLVDIEGPARRAGVPELCQDERVSWVNLSKGTFERRRLPDAKVLKDISLPSLLSQYPLVSIPVMKTHGKTTVSVALKNSWGLLPMDRYRLHPVVDDAIADLFHLATPVFSVVDATLCLEGRGPKSGRPRRVDHVFAGAHSAVVDWACAKLMGFDPASIPHIVGALPKGFMGEVSLQREGPWPDIAPFLKPGHNLISSVEGRLQGSALKTAVFDTALFPMACQGARAWYFLWYHLGPGRNLREAP